MKNIPARSECHHHDVVPPARISLTLSRHFSLSFIASGRSSGLHPVSSHSCCMYVLAGHPAFAWSYAGVHRSTSLMSSSLLLQQCPACLVHLTCIVFVMGSLNGLSVYKTKFLKPAHFKTNKKQLTVCKHFHCEMTIKNFFT